ncbi:MAG: class I SAM-dependent methyltransferase, partial [Methylococcales bacterium]
ITVIDYGAGTGFATLELIKGLEGKGLLRQFKESRVDFRLAVCDFPSGWFAKAFELLRRFPFVSFYSLKDHATARVRMLSEIFPPGSVDMIFASMVFHLMPPGVLASVSDSFAKVLRPRGLLLWNTPDTVPTLACSEVIHAANRMLRKRLSRLLDGESNLSSLVSTIPEAMQAELGSVVSRFENLMAELDPITRNAARQRAEKQILPLPTDVGIIRQAMERNFSGGTRIKLSTISDEELLTLALLPANQRNAGEIGARDLREKVLTLLLQYDILPKIHASSAGIATGMILHWTFGTYIKKSSSEQAI